MGLLLNAFILITVIVPITFQYGSSNCPIEKGSCSCFAEGGGHNLWCPDSTFHKVQIFYRPGLVRIICNTEAELTAEELLYELREVSIGAEKRVEFLTIMHCPIPGFSYSNFTTSMNITSLKKFFLEYSRSPGKMLMKGQFQGMPADLERIAIKTTNLQFETPNLFVSGTFLGMEDQLVIIELVNNGIHYLPPDLFSSLNKLEYLSLKESTLKELPPSLLAEQKQLRRFVLHGKSLPEIPEDFFRESVRLQTLVFIKMNILNSVSSSLFSNLKELKGFNVSGNFLQKCPEGIFNQNEKFEQLKWTYYRPCQDCSYSEGVSVKVPNFIRDVKSLKKFEIIWDRKYELVIEKNFFQGCYGLEKLKINRAKLQSLPENVFQDAYKIRSINLRDNSLNTLHDSVFRGLTKLENLFLSRNVIKRITNDIFSDLRSLKYIDLSDNEITKIDKFAFHITSKLEELNLRNNFIDYDDYTEPSWESLKRAKKIDLSNNHIKVSYLNRDILVNLLNLEELDLSNNEVGPHLGSLEFIQNNILIDLSNNKIEGVSPLISLGDKTRSHQAPRVLLKGNPLKCDCEALPFYLYLQGGSLNGTKIPDGEDLKCASPLNLRGQRFMGLVARDFVCEFPSDNIPNFSCPCKRCLYIPFSDTVKVDCSYMKLKAYPLKMSDSIRESKWISLNMTGNNIKGTLIPPESYRSNLTELHLSKNLVSSFPLPVPGRLEVLYLDHNHLELNDEDVNLLLSNNHNLKALSLANNSYPCNCRSAPLFRLIKNYPNSNLLSIIDSDKIALKGCDLDEWIGDVLISQFSDEEDFCWDVSKLIVIYVLPIILAILFILAFIVISLCYKDNLRIVLYQYPIFRKYFVRNDESRNPYDVFVSYSHEDSDYVENKLVRGLESPDDDPLLKYKVLLASRDFIPGKIIAEQILHAIENSSRTIIVFSKAFLQSDWAQYEFEMAHERNKVILLKYGDLPPNDDIGPVLKKYIGQNTYLEYDHVHFWRNLRYALPHKGSSKSWPAWLRTRKPTDRIHLIETATSTPIPPIAGDDSSKEEHPLKNGSSLYGGNPPNV